MNQLPAKIIVKYSNDSFFSLFFYSSTLEILCETESFIFQIWQKKTETLIRKEKLQKKEAIENNAEIHS